MVTLKDIAKECGCSVTSVSRALKNSDTISDRLKKLVREKVEELGYIPNTLAGSMRTGQTHTIALLLQDLRNPYYALLAKFIESYASTKGYSVFIMATSENPVHELDGVVKAMQKNVDGILLMPVQQDTKAVNLLKNKNFPFVLVGRAFDEIETDYVLIDDVKGAYLATEHMIKSGHKRILFINSLLHIYSARMRQIGFREALQAYDIAEQPQDIHNISMDIGETRSLIKEVFSQKNDYTAILFFCDLMAFEGVNALRALGYRIPEDIALASNDDIHSDIIMPIKLTSAGFSREQMAKRSIDILIKKIEEPAPEAESNPQYIQECLEVSLSIGETT